MNRLIIKQAAPGACSTCAGIGRVWVQVNDYGIAGAFPCPACENDEDLSGLLAPLMDYLARPCTPGPVIA